MEVLAQWACPDRDGNNLSKLPRPGINQITEPCEVLEEYLEPRNVEGRGCQIHYNDYKCPAFPGPVLDYRFGFPFFVLAAGKNDQYQECLHNQSRVEPCRRPKLSAR